jgi:hypothetical protein
MRNVAKEFVRVKGTGFSPYINLAKMKRALAPEESVLGIVFLIAATLIATSILQAQTTTSSGPIAIVPLESKNPDAAAKVTGALEVSQGKAVIGASGSVTAGGQTTEVLLPHRGVLRVCASTTVKLAADSSAPAGETPGLMMAIDHGAVELSFATARNADILMTPDFRILIGGPGAADVKVRLGQHGDTCVDNAGVNAPYVLVTGIFDSGDYRVQSGQRVMFQHGSLHELVDNEKESCGCPPPTRPGTNEFPLAQSAGLEPTPKPSPSIVQSGTTAPIEPLVYKSPAPTTTEATPAVATPQPAKPAVKKKQGRFGGLGRFFRRLFGAE